MFCIAPVRMAAQGQSPTTETKQPQWKDRAEYDLYDAILKDNNPKTKLEKLQQWQTQYPSTEWSGPRKQLFLTTYAALNMAKETIDAAKQILADDPKNFSAMYYIMYFTQMMYGQVQSPDTLDQGEKSATTILANINTPPANVSEEQWKQLRPQVELLAHVNLGFIAMQRKNWDAAEAEFTKSLQMSPNNGQVDYWMGFVIASEKKTEKVPTALFYFARAAAYDGTGAMAADGRKQALDYVKRQYKIYHGSDDGFDKLIAAAKSSPTPPADFKIEDAGAIAKENLMKEEELEKAHPQEALWKSIKEALTGPDGANYFNSSMKDALLPTLKGRVVSMTPALKPKTIVLAMNDLSTPLGTAGDATLKFDTPLAGKVDAGTELTFEGVPESYTASPFMVMFNVEKDKLHGWTGKNAPAAPVHHRPAPRKK
ncbi:MAG TPA: tetratricopeptide repeat protein [Bryobacteraceae bacterium]|nr:tetratricopeptide repeat protein [Bryobacteraceae bacterium]